MLKNIWRHLTKEDRETKGQIVSVRLLIVLLLAVLLAPVFWHRFIIIPVDDSTSQEELDSLKLVYFYKKDSLDRVKPTIVYKEGNRNSYKESYSKRSYSSSKFQSKEEYKAKDYKKDTIDQKPTLHRFSLNNATVEDLTQVSGIGEVFANRILKYRSSLGGFYDKTQLYEVYGIDSAVVEKAFKVLDDSDLSDQSKIKINKIEFKALLKHPYLEYKDVKKIFNNRPIFSDEMFCRLMPNHCNNMTSYLDYEE